MSWGRRCRSPLVFTPAAVLIALIEQAVPDRVAGRNLLDRFQFIIRSKAAQALQAWLNDAAQSLLSSFARGIDADQLAVAAAMTGPWSTGQTEGQITKLKMIKRRMYGRANLDCSPRAYLPLDLTHLHRDRRITPLRC